MLVKWLRKMAFRRGYLFTFKKMPQYDIAKKRLAIPRDMEPAFVDIFRKTGDYTLTSIECMCALYDAVKYICAQGIEGDFVECGVWRGGSCMLIAHTLLELGETSRKIYMYDTYTGMTKPAEIDLHIVDGTEQISRWEQFQRDGYNEWCYASLEEVGANIRSTGYPADNIVMVKGEVEKTIPATVPDKIALLRLDTDWYQSTYHEMIHLYPRLAKDGVLIVDDYGSYQGSREAVDQYYQENALRMLLHRIDTAARIGIKTA